MSLGLLLWLQCIGILVFVFAPHFKSIKFVILVPPCWHHVIHECRADEDVADAGGDPAKEGRAQKKRGS
jgi:hypothetical protein